VVVEAIRCMRCFYHCRYEMVRGEGEGDGDGNAQTGESMHAEIPDSICGSVIWRWNAPEARRPC
jgi:hypothetical protein